MLDDLRQHWRDFINSPPGKRFCRVHQRRAKRHGGGIDWRRWGLLILGILLALAGVFFLAAPGPGLLVLAAGLALIAGESLTVARMLDWSELKLRPLYLWASRRWRQAGPRLRWGIIACAALGGLAAMLAAYFLFLS